MFWLHFYHKIAGFGRAVQIKWTYPKKIDQTKMSNAIYYLSSLQAWPLSLPNTWELLFQTRVRRVGAGPSWPCGLLTEVSRRRGLIFSIVVQKTSSSRRCAICWRWAHFVWDFYMSRRCLPCCASVRLWGVWAGLSLLGGRWGPP